MGRPLLGALAFLGLVLAWGVAQAQQPASCIPHGPGERVEVDHVYDGDTVRLRDGRRVRLIGIDSPEIGRRGEASEPYARRALDTLTTLLGEDRQVRLLGDTQAEDHYGRALGHLFLTDGSNLQALLLSKGLATLLVIPPNLAYLDCYRAAESQAMANGIGLWSHPRYRPRPAADPGLQKQGYRLVHGAVLRVGNSPTALWLQLAPGLALRISRDDLGHFDYDPGELLGRRVLARGKLYRHGDELRMRIRHPAMLEPLPPGEIRPDFQGAVAP